MIRPCASMLLSSSGTTMKIHGLAQRLLVRTFVAKAPGLDPLEVLQKECVHRKLCNVDGYRSPGVHWVFSVAMAAPPSADLGPTAPNLRTVGIQRVSPRGIDFVMKKGSLTASSILEQELPVAILYTQGKYAPGQAAEQWRGEGVCEALPLDDLLDVLPHYTLTGMIVSKRIEMENLEKGDGVSDRLELMSRSHVTEVTQKTRLELENGQVSREELDRSIQGFRFLPDRLERMHGGPDSVLWERWEWRRAASSEESNSSLGGLAWNPPKHLLPH